MKNKKSLLPSCENRSGALRKTRTMRQNDIPKLVVPVMAVVLIAAMTAAMHNAPALPLSGIRLAVALLSAGLFVFSFSSLIGGVWTVGMLPPMCIATFFFVCAARWPQISDPSSGAMHTPYVIIALLAVIVAAVIVAVSALMLRASHNTAHDGQRVTVVVLGCKVKGDRPSRMLEGRLRAAAAYLSRNAETMCIVSGGQGSDEEFAEAHIMRDYLLALGIDSSRIIVEDRSVSTRENLAFSLELIRAYGLPEHIAVATDRFHQYRASLIARNLGLQTCAINRETRWYLVMQYWFREVAGIIELRIRGH